QVDRNDLSRLARAECAVAHCPRSNARLRCGRMPYGAYREAGVRLALGTDSLASSDSLSIWEEAAVAWSLHARNGDASRPADWLRLGTLGGAEALGVARELGSLAEGKCADMACASLDGLSEDQRSDADLVLLALVEGRLSVGALPV
ncbi:MAG: amidohydrolase family protein, partial [Ktedonobacterales bacterium]